MFELSKNPHHHHQTHAVNFHFQLNSMFLSFSANDWKKTDFLLTNEKVKEKEKKIST